MMATNVSSGRVINEMSVTGSPSTGMTPNDTGTPQGGIISPLLANIALSVLDNHFQRRWDALGHKQKRSKARRAGVEVCRLVRYADDFVVLVHGTREQTEALRGEVAEVLAPMGLRLSEAKTQVVHMNQGFDFLGFRIQRCLKRGTQDSWAVYTFPSKKALASIVGKVRDATRKNQARHLAGLLHRLNATVRGWCTYFRHAASKATFSYLTAFTWKRVYRWLRTRHPKTPVRELRRRFLPGWRPTEGTVQLYYAGETVVTRYRYRGERIPNPWNQTRAA